MKSTQTYHAQRIKDQLTKAGVTSYGALKMESRYLPEIIHEDEDIGGVIYGQGEAGSAMFVATNKRLIFIDKKPFFTTTDELSYDVLSGVKLSHGGIFHAVDIHTRVGEYNLKYVNKKCAATFIKYIEKKRIEQSKNQ